MAAIAMLVVVVVVAFLTLQFNVAKKREQKIIKKEEKIK